MEQTLEQGLQIYQNWISTRAPKTLLQTEHNATIIGLWIDQNCNGRMSLGNLDAAVHALGNIARGGRLEYYQPAPAVAPAPPAPTQAQIDAQKARQKLDYENEHPLTYGGQVVRQALEANEANKKAAEAKIELRAKQEKAKVRELIQRRIDRHYVQAPSGRKDFARTEREKAELQKQFDAGLMPSFEKYDA